MCGKLFVLFVPKNFCNVCQREYQRWSVVGQVVATVWLPDCEQRQTTNRNLNKYKETSKQQMEI